MPIAVTDAAVRDAVAAIEAVIGDQVARAARAPARHRGGRRRRPLTDDQRAALDAIRADLAGERPMMRLLQGDVGSGKTARGRAGAGVRRRHRRTRPRCSRRPTCSPASTPRRLRRLLEPLGHDVTLLTGSMPAGAATRGARAAWRADADRSRVAAGAAWSSAPTPWSRTRSPSPTCDWWSSTSSIASASPSARRSTGKGTRAARPADDRDADPAHAGPDRPRRPGRVRPAHAAAGPPEDRAPVSGAPTSCCAAATAGPGALPLHRQGGRRGPSRVRGRAARRGRRRLGRAIRRGRRRARPRQLERSGRRSPAWTCPCPTIEIVHGQMKAAERDAAHGPIPRAARCRSSWARPCSRWASTCPRRR